MCASARGRSRRDQRRSTRISADWLPPLSAFACSRRARCARARAEIRVLPGRGRQRRRRRQHDGRDRHGQRFARRDHRELRHERHDLRLREQAGGRPEGEIAAFCSSTGGWLPLFCTMNVTTVTEQVRDALRLGSCGAGGGGRRTLPPARDGLCCCPISPASGRRTCRTERVCCSG